MRRRKSRFTDYSLRDWISIDLSASDSESSLIVTSSAKSTMNPDAPRSRAPEAPRFVWHESVA